MATKAKAKRKTTKRKKRRTSSKVSGITMKVDGKTFKKEGCSDTKGGRKKVADALKAKGFTYRTVGKCVFRGPKRKK